MKELWKPVVGYEDRYEVSNMGRVRGLKYGKLIKHSLTLTGYHTVGLYRDYKTYRTTVHRVVAQAFLPNPDNLPQVNHIDEDKNNNTVENLEWCTAKYNANYGEKQQAKKRAFYSSPEHKVRARKNGASKQRGVAQYKDGVEIARFQSMRAAARAINGREGGISTACAKGIRHMGFNWKYIEGGMT